MALTIAIEGKGVIANCDQLTNDTGGTGTGDWSEQGGGTMTLSPDVFLYGTGSIGGKYASKSGLQQFDLGAGNELDFTAGTGSEDGQFIYMWVNMAAFGALDTLANYGLCVRISSSSPGTSNYVDYRIGSDTDSNGWTGGWKIFVIDPTKAGSRVSGTQSSIIASVRTLGIWIDTASSVRAESLWIDQIAVGSGLRITGSSTTGWKDVADYCTDYANRAWGMVQERDGVYYAFGKMYIGDTTQTAVTDFSDANRVIKFGTSQYYNSSNTWATSFDVDGAGVVVEDDTVYKTDFTDGVIVGTDNGRSGCVYIGNDDQDVSFDLYGGNITTSRSYLYGSSLQQTRGTITIGASHRMYGATVNDIGQIDPIGIAEIENVTVIGSAADSALLITASNEMSIIKIDSFIDNNTGTTGSAGHAIELTATGTHAFVDISFSGGGGTQGSNLTPSSGSTTADVYNNSGGAITINVSDGGDTPSVRNAASSTTTVVNSVAVKVTAQDSAGDKVQNARVHVEADSGGDLPYKDSVTITSVTTTASVAHTAHGLSNGDRVVIRGAAQDEYNGMQTISNVSTNAYDYTISATTSPATGTITSTSVILDGLTSALGVVEDTGFNYSSAQPIIGHIRKGTTSPYYKTSPISGSITSSGFETLITLVGDE